jgi:dihydroflavonol-4-reductase
MKVAVTGASGYLGNCLCKTLAEKDVRLKVLVHKNRDEFVKMGNEIVFGDILNKATLQELVKDADVVYHLAAALSIGEKNSKLVHEINVIGARNIIEVCNSQKVKKLVYFSSIKTLQTSDPNDLLDEFSPLITYSKSAYDSSKAEAERLVLQATEQGLDAVILNPTAIIGPYDYQPSYLGQALIKIYQNSIPMLVSGGYDFVDVRDVIEGAINAASKGRKGERYILSGGWLSLKDLSEKIQKLTRKKTTKLIAPIFLAKAGLPFINVYSKFTTTRPLYTSESLDNIKFSNKCISNLKARQELGFNPRPIENTLADAFVWFGQNNMV